MTLLANIMGIFTSFQPGSRLVDGGECRQMAAMLFQEQTGIEATAGGGQANAAPLLGGLCLVENVATGADSVALPQAIPGRTVVVRNSGGNSMQVFGMVLNPVTGVGDTISPSGSNVQAATATGVAHADATTYAYRCYVAGQWVQD